MGNASGVTRVGVTRCGNWWCHHNFPQKTDDFFLVISRSLKRRPVFSHHLLAVPTLSALQRHLSSVLCQFSHKILVHWGVTPGWCHPGRSAPPLVTPLINADARVTPLPLTWGSERNTLNEASTSHVCGKQILLHGIVYIIKHSLHTHKREPWSPHSPEILYATQVQMYSRLCHIFDTHIPIWSTDLLSREKIRSQHLTYLSAKNKQVVWRHC